MPDNKESICEQERSGSLTEQDKAQLDQVLRKVSNKPCTKCALSQSFPTYGKDNCLDGKGPDNPDILVVTQGILQGSGYIGENQYRELHNKFRYLNLDQSKIRYTRALRCGETGGDYAPTGSPTIKDYLNSCRSYLEEEIAATKPKVVLLVGGSAIYSALQFSWPFEKYYGRIAKKKIDGDNVFFICLEPAGSFTATSYEVMEFIPYLVKGGIYTDTTIKHKIIKDINELNKVVDLLKSQDEIAFDFEVDTPLDSETSRFGDNDKLLGLGVAWGGNRSVFIPLDHKDSPFLDNDHVKNKVVELLTSPVKKIAHNAIYDCFAAYHFLNKTKVRNVSFDTMLAHHLIDPTPGTHGLKHLAGRFCGLGGYEEDLYEILYALPKNQQNFANIDLDILGTYCNYDCIATQKLKFVLENKINANDATKKLFNKITMPAHEAVFDLRTRDWFIDEARFNELTEYYSMASRVLKEKLNSLVVDLLPNKYTCIEDLGDLNLNSTKQLSEILSDMNIVPVGRTKTGKFSTDELSLKLTLGNQDDPLKREFLETILKFRKYSKLDTTYLEGFKKHIVNGTLKCQFNLIGTRSSRLSSSAPNMQNIVSTDDKNYSVKSIFIAPKDFEFVVADYSQIELRNLANCTKDPGIIELFLKGVNIHAANAAQVFGMPYEEVDKKSIYYRVGKTLGFAAVYGAGPTRITEQIQSDSDITPEQILSAADRLGISYPKKVNITALLNSVSKEILNNIYAKWKKVVDWHRSTRAFAEKFRKISSPFGRTRYFAVTEKNVFNTSINHPIQSVSSDCLMLALIELNKQLKNGFKSYIIGTVHDSIIFYVHKDEKEVVLKLIKKIMEEEPIKYQPDFFSVPMKVEIECGPNWANLEEVTL